MFKVTAQMCKDRVVDDLGLILYDDAPYSILGGGDHQRGIRIFYDIIKRSLAEFSRYYANWLAVDLTESDTDTGYTFVDNFDKYLAGDIGEDDIELVPISISKVGKRFVSAYYYIYKAPTLYAINSALTGLCYYFCEHPNRMEIGPDGEFTEDSAIYFLKEGLNDKFFTWLSLETAKRINRIVKAMPFGGNIEILPDLDSTISELQEMQDEYIETAGVIMNMWRK